MEVYLEEEAFHEKYKPITNPRDGSQEWDHQDLKNADIPPERIWTCLTGDNNSMSLVSGWHWVNRLYYVVTEEPWQGDDEIIVVYEEEHGECDVCGEDYELDSRLDHCPEEGTCWEHCTDVKNHIATILEAGVV